MTTFIIKRLRKQYNGVTKWVPIGTVVITKEGGSIYLHHIDETWRLFPKEAKAAKEGEADATETS